MSGCLHQIGTHIDLQNGVPTYIGSSGGDVSSVFVSPIFRRLVERGRKRREWAIGAIQLWAAAGIVFVHATESTWLDLGNFALSFVGAWGIVVLLEKSPKLSWLNG